MDSSSLKNEPGPSTPRKRVSTDGFEPESKKMKTDQDEDSGPKTFRASGLKLTLHGVIFQLELLMHFVHHANKMGYTFCLATEMDEAEKLDDVVLKYKHNGEVSTIFVQAKHIKKPITIANLKARFKDDDFGLVKYFDSFRKIKLNPKFKDTKLRCFLVTNTDFVFSEYVGASTNQPKNDNFKIWANCFEKKPVSSENQFLFIKDESFGAHEYKLILNTSNELMKFIKRNFKGVTDQELKDFTDQFSFITKFPNQENLKELIADELNETYCLDVDLMYPSFEHEMLEFLKDYTCKEARYLEDKEAKEFFTKLIAKINGLMVTGSSKAYTYELKSYGIHYKNNLEELYTFLSNKESPIFCVSTESTRLSAIKVLETLTAPVQPLTCEGKEQIKKLKLNNHNIIFIPLKTLLCREIQKGILNSFQETYDLMVIVCQSEDLNDNQKSLFRELKKIQNETNSKLKKIQDGKLSKKLIVIASNQKQITYISNLEFSTKHHDDSSFTDLDEDSQAALLQKKVKSQRKIVTLSQLIDTNFAAKVFSSGKTLTKLLDEPKMENEISLGLFPIGNQKGFSSNGYNPDYYIPRNLSLDGDVRKEGSILHKYATHDKKEKIVLIANDSGMGKSTLLTSLATTIKNSDDNDWDSAWIVRIDLNEYGILEETEDIHLSKIKLREGSETKDAAEFLAKIAVPCDKITDPVINQVQREIFISSLIDEYEKMPKIILLFDGFDEICPHFEEKTTKWLKALAGSHVAQMFVATRLNKKSHLENALNTSAYILNPLHETEQKSFISKFWKWNFKNHKDSNDDKVTCKGIIKYLKEIHKSSHPVLANQIADIFEKFPSDCDFEADVENMLEKLKKCIDHLDFDEYIDILLEQQRIHGKNKEWSDDDSDFDEYIDIPLEQKRIRGKNDEFTDNPLHLEMLSKVVLGKKFPLPNKLNFSNLFEEFIEIKFEILHRDKCNKKQTTVAGERIDDSDSYSLDKVHEELAVRVFFHQEIKTLPHSNELKRYQEILERGNKKRAKNARITAEEELLRIGLLTPIRDQFRFIHRIFAEYFMSKYLITYLTNNEVQKVLVGRIFYDSEYELICKFFNDDLKRNPTKIGTKLLPETIDHINRNLNSQKTGLNSFHKLTKKGYDKIVELILKNAEHELLENLLTKLYNGSATAMYLAVNGNHSETVKILLKYGLKLDIKVLKNKILKVKGSILIMAMNKKATLEVILSFLQENQEYLTPEFVTELILYTNSRGKSALDQALLRFSKENVKFLLTWVEQQLGKEALKDLIFKKSSYLSGTALHTAFIKRDENVMATIFETIEKNFDESILRELILQTNNFGGTVLIEVINKKRNTSIKEFATFRLNQLNERVIKLFVERIEKIYDLECIEDLAVISVYGDFRADPKIVVDKLLDIIDKSTKNDQIKKILHIIKSHMDEIQMTATKINKIHENDKQEGLKEVELKEVLDEFKSKHYDCENYESTRRIRVKALALTRDENNRSRAVLYEAVEHDRKEFVRIFLYFVKDFPRFLEEMILKINNSENDTCLHRAGRNGHHEIVSMLLTSLKEKSEILATPLPSAISSTKFHMSEQHTEGEHDNYHKTIQVFLKFVLDNLPKLMIKIVEEIGGGSEALNWAQKNNFNDLKNWLATYLSPYEYHKYVLFQKFENDENIVDRFEQLKVKEHLLDKNEKGETLLDVYLNRREFDDSFLKWLCNHLKEDPSQVRKIFLGINISSAQNIHFLSWIKDNLEDEIPGIIKEMLFMRSGIGDTPLMNALRDSHYNATQIFNWVKENCDTETSTDLLLATNAFKYTILHYAACQFDFERSGERMNFVLNSLEDHPDIITKLILKTNVFNNTALQEIEEEMQGHSPPRENVENQIVLNRLKSIYDQTASSILDSNTDLSIFDIKDFNVLKKYIQESYKREDKERILEKIDEVCTERFNNKYKNCIDTTVIN